MNDFKIGDKVLIEAEIFEKYKFGGYDFYKVRAVNKEKETVDMKAAYVYPLSEHPGKTYEDGLNEVWELMKRISFDDYVNGFKVDELVQIFNAGNCDRILKENTPQEALEKIKAWEEVKKIHVGDVVTDYEDNPALVIRKNYDNRTCMVMYGDFSTEEKEIEALSKTGKTIDLSSLLAMVGGETNGKDKD